MYDTACLRAQSDVAHRFCITSFQWNYYFVSFEGDFTSDPAYDLVTFGWCVCGQEMHQQMCIALILCDLCARAFHRTTSTLTYNNAPTLAPIQSSFSMPTSTITTKCARAHWRYSNAVSALRPST